MKIIALMPRKSIFTWSYLRSIISGKNLKSIGTAWYQADQGEFRTLNPILLIHFALKCYFLYLTNFVRIKSFNSKTRVYLKWQIKSRLLVKDIYNNLKQTKLILI